MHLTLLDRKGEIPYQLYAYGIVSNIKISKNQGKTPTEIDKEVRETIRSLPLEEPQRNALSRLIRSLRKPKEATEGAGIGGHHGPEL